MLAGEAYAAGSIGVVSSNEASTPAPSNGESLVRPVTTSVMTLLPIYETPNAHRAAAIYYTIHPAAGRARNAASLNNADSFICFFGEFVIALSITYFPLSLFYLSSIESTYAMKSLSLKTQKYFADDVSIMVSVIIVFLSKSFSSSFQ